RASHGAARRRRHGARERGPRIAPGRPERRRRRRDEPRCGHLRPPVDDHARARPTRRARQHDRLAGTRARAVDRGPAMRRAGFSLVELLVALGLGLSLAIAAVVATTVALRHLVRTALRAEVDDLAAMALEAFTLDVRRAGFDPRAVGVAAVAEATTARL